MNKFTLISICYLSIQLEIYNLSCYSWNLMMGKMRLKSGNIPSCQVNLFRNLKITKSIVSKVMFPWVMITHYHFNCLSIILVLHYRRLSKRKEIQWGKRKFKMYLSMSQFEKEVYIVNHFQRIKLIQKGWQISKKLKSEFQMGIPLLLQARDVWESQWKGEDFKKNKVVQSSSNHKTLQRGKQYLWLVILWNLHLHLWILNH